MKSGFDRLNLRPFERRLVVVVGTVVFLVLNVVFVWPHFSDRGKAIDDLNSKRKLLDKFEKAIAEKPGLLAKVKALESEAEPVPPEDQALQFRTAIQMQASQSGVNWSAGSPQITRTNQFFIEQSQTISVVAAEPPLLDFLYSLGAGGSAIRVRGLSLSPDAPRQQLAGNATLVASYQKNPPKPAPKPAAPPATTAKADTPVPKPDKAVARVEKPPGKAERPAAKSEKSAVPPERPTSKSDKPTDKRP